MDYLSALVEQKRIISNEPIYPCINRLHFCVFVSFFNLHMLRFPFRGLAQTCNGWQMYMILFIRILRIEATDLRLWWRVAEYVIIRRLRMRVRPSTESNFPRMVISEQNIKLKLSIDANQNSNNLLLQRKTKKQIALPQRIINKLIIICWNIFRWVVTIHIFFIYLVFCAFGPYDSTATTDLSQSLIIDHHDTYQYDSARPCGLASRKRDRDLPNVVKIFVWIYRLCNVKKISRSMRLIPSQGLQSVFL